jgi:predicted ATPase/predicted Ser/Thr protein kinase
MRLLAGPSWSLCEDLIKAFEQAWQAGGAPAIDAYLRGDGPQRLALLVELVHVDLELRLKAGEPARVETYLRAYPELATARGAILELIAAEFEVRQLREEGVAMEEYRRRFPEYVDDLAHLTLIDPDTPHPGGPVAPVGPTPWPEVPGYEIVAEIGRGGMGVIYKAREPILGRHVALKFLPGEYARDPDRLERFRREARTASALNHPHICTIHALGEHEGRPFIVMEFIEGQTLQALASRRPTIEEVARWIGQATRALAAAHAAGVVHRDIKPENIMVRADGYVKVLDFGLVRLLPTLARPIPGAGRDTDPGAVLGTAAYMSPEQARGEPADSAADVFSLGIVLYQLVTAQHPFEAESALGMMYAIATQPVVSPSRLAPTIPASLEGLTLAMLHKDPRLRPTAAEVEAILEAIATRGPARAAPAGPGRPIVHREPELAALRAALAAAETGRGSIVCVTGEPGIGKTTLVEAFLDELVSPEHTCLVARGRCSERLAGTEAYLPVLDALADLQRGAASGTVARLLKVVAPTWHTQIAPSAAVPQVPPHAGSQQAMLREFGALLEEMARLGPVVLFLDDVHWADLSTVDLLAHLGRHCQGLRVLIVVTYRPTEMLLGPHPFHAVRLELQGKGVCTELSLGFLDRQDVDRYLALAFPGHAFGPDLADLVFSRTEGSPLFMVDLLRYLGDQGVIAEQAGRWSLARALPELRRELPQSIRSMIERKLLQLDEAQRHLLLAASVQGHEFDSAVLATALKRDPGEVEDCLQVLERAHRLVRLVRESEFPDRTLTLRYAFVHVLYQQALYNDLTPTRRASLAAALARALEGHHREASHVVAAELACLYEVGRDFGRAAWQFRQAAQNAARVFAHREAVVLAQRGLRLLEALPVAEERTTLEVLLQITLGLQLQVTEGYAAPGAKAAYCRARELCEQSDASAAPPFPVLWGLWLFHKVRSELSRAQELAGELLSLSRRESDPNLALQAHQALGITALCRGEPAAALDHVEQAAALYDPDRHRTHSFLFGQDPGVICKAFGAVALWLLGYPDQAERQSNVAIEMSRALSPTNQAVAQHFAAMVHQLRRDGPRVQQHAGLGHAIAVEHGFSFWRAGSAVLGGWAMAAGGVAEGLARLRQGLVEWAATGSVTYRTYYLGLLVEVLLEQGELQEARRVVEEALALVEQTGERLYESELHRLRGELHLYGSAEPSALRQAEEDFRRALETARRDEARSLELRAAMNLAHLDRAADRRKLLDEVVGRFTEGFQTADLIEARAVLDSLSD